MEGNADHSVYDSAPGTPLPVGETDRFLEQPRASFLDSNPGDSVQSTPNNSSPLLTTNKSENNGSEHAYRQTKPGSQTKRRRLIIMSLVGLGVLAVIVLAVVIPVYFEVIKPKQKQDNVASSSSAGSSSVGSGSGNPASPSGATSGGDGSEVITDNGTTFTYKNSFGGYWVYDPNDPFNNNARPNSWTPPLNTSWDWTTDRIYGVNLGGLFVIEPFITPSFFEKYTTAVDEWTLSEAMTADTSTGGGLSQLEDHYNTFITEQDIAEIAGAGLNWIRLPIPYWAIETWPGEPFLAKTSWKYILRVLGWARKYGLRVNLDLHTIPGSQNGYNHSGKLGQVNFLNGVMGIANAQRTLNYIRIITEFITQQEYLDVVPMFGIVNEALLTTIGSDQLTEFYLEAHDMIRGITGLGAGNGPFISIHDGFVGLDSWAGFLPGSDRINIDTHPYFAFDDEPNDSPIATGLGSDAGGIWPAQACNAWGPDINSSRSDFGVTIAGEFSNGYNDCGLFLKGTSSYTPSYGGDCSLWQDASTWNDTVIAGVKAFALASMDATQNWFFWTWKIGNSTANNRVESPLWSYQLGLQGGWIPTDPRDAVGVCAAQGVSQSWNQTFQAWQTGGTGAGTIAATATAEFGIWPPAQISGVAAAQMAFVPTYTPTGSVATLPPPTLTSTTKSISEGNGWFDSSDTTSAATAIAGCSYPDAWDAISATVPATVCGGGSVTTTSSATTATTASTSASIAGVTSVSTTTGDDTTPTIIA
ncbi:glycoside hydrolase family 5 protein [Lentinula aciculospora]|uniref:glucan 1,3-beta-glucosidase n=1 Tax=Lentinula aciculospora TaxID=153920 RepID=A0A9W9A1M1_9AGAR|nr:glycoside hydrolase family 5 protein [Lentinula aciculospora]